MLQATLIQEAEYIALVVEDTAEAHALITSHGQNTLRYVSAYYPTGAVIAVQLKANGRIVAQALVNPGKQNRALTILSKSRSLPLRMGTAEAMTSANNPHRLALIGMLRRAAAHVTLRPNWSDAVAAFLADSESFKSVT